MILHLRDVEEVKTQEEHPRWLQDQASIREITARYRDSIASMWHAAGDQEGRICRAAAGRERFWK